MATTEASAVSLRTLIEFEVIGGTTMRIACGSTTFAIKGSGLRPRARAASNWPRGTASMPALKISAE